MEMGGEGGFREIRTLVLAMLTLRVFLDSKSIDGWLYGYEAEVRVLSWRHEFESHLCTLRLERL